jgi:signal-transduction protein with cAMP-binding, CBS, and nucleotidyltransferase domain
MIHLLKETRLFRQCTTKELRDIARLCQNLTFKEGEHIFEAKNPAVYLYLVDQGTIDLRFSVTYYETFQELTIDRKFRGEAFGWSALIEPRIYTLTAIAAKDSQLVKINESDIHKLCKENSRLGYIIMKNISQIVGERFDLIQKMLFDIIQKSLKEKEL